MWRLCRTAIYLRLILNGSVLFWMMAASSTRMELTLGTCWTMTVLFDEHLTARSPAFRGRRDRCDR
jgi:hypothetical protein